MKKLRIIFILVLFLLVGMSLNVYADGSACKYTSGDDCALYTPKYNSPSIQTVEGSTIPVYGMSMCNVNTKSCDYSYFSMGPNVEDYFKTYLVCPNGETAVGYNDDNVYNVASSGYKDSYSGDEDGTFYWIEDYALTCITSSDNGKYDHVVFLDNTGTSSGTTGGTSDGTSGGSSSGITGEYPSSSTVDNENTGVFTYYVVLVVIAFMSYILLLVSKKFNLFKKI